MKQGVDSGRRPWRRRLRRLEWPLVAALAVLALGLGLAGFHRHLVAGGVGVASRWDVIYLSLQLFVLESGAVLAPMPWQLQAARFLAPAVGAYAAIRALALLFAGRLERVRIRFQRGHVVVCGLGQKGLVLSQSLRRQGDRVVLIEEDAENDFIAAARAHGVLVLVGDARDAATLRSAGVANARHLVAVTGDDGDNAAIAVSARSLAMNEGSRPLRCVAHLVEPRLCDLLRLHEISRPQDDTFRLDFVNVYESGARALLREHPVPAAAAGAGARDGVVIVVVGLGHFGESLVLRAAWDWRMARGDQENPEPPMTGSEEERRGTADAEAGEAAPKLHVRVVDRDATALAESLELRYPWVRDTCTLEPWDLDIDSPAFARGDFLSQDQDRGLTVAAVYICLDDDSAGLLAGLTAQRHLKGRGVPVVVRMVHGAGLAALLGEQTSGTGFEGLHAFGLLDRLWNPNLLFAGATERLARAMHEEYVRHRRLAAERAEEPPPDPASDPAVRPWEELDEGLRESNRAQAAHVGTKLAALGCDLAPLSDPDTPHFRFYSGEVERLARMEHERWMAERLHEGWRPGPRNPEEKTSPYLVPWEELDETAQERDLIYIRGLPAFLAGVGFQMVRRGGVEERGPARVRAGHIGNRTDRADGSIDSLLTP